MNVILSVTLNNKEYVYHDTEEIILELLNNILRDNTLLFSLKENGVNVNVIKSKYTISLDLDFKIMVVDNYKEEKVYEV
jgi:hypothetical protein